MHVVLPGNIDDPGTPSGGNTYDRRVCAGLAGAGWTVREHAVPGSWPRPDAGDRAALARMLAALPDGATVLVDGLVGSAVPDLLGPHAGRLRLVPLVHMPLDDAAEAATLAVATAVVTTSAWTKTRLVERYGLPADRVWVARPGVDPASPVPGSATGAELLCVAAVTPQKGHDILVAALARVADLPWRCACVGALTRDPDFVGRLRDRVRRHDLDDRVRFLGPRTGSELSAAYARADLLVLASRGETYGMVVTEALARGVPVLATAVGGLAEALGRTSGAGQPGLLVRPDDPAALAGALRRWLGDAELRRRLRGSALARRDTLAGWPDTVDRVAAALAPPPPS